MKPRLPFSEIYRPVAQQFLAEADAPAPIRSAFARQLERRLAEVLSQCLYLLFTAHRMSWNIFRGTRIGCYRSFVEDIRRAGLDKTLQDYPVAVEAIGILGKQARTSAEDFASHLQEDRTAMASLLDSRRCQKLAKVTAGWSDAHRDGRTVVQVIFENGERLFYKPRSLAVDKVWKEGLERINKYLPLPLLAPAVADCGDHGWTEVIPIIRNVTKEEAEAFYWRYGALLFLAWLLDAVDLHRDNIIVCGAHPVAVDVEGLMHPLSSSEKRSLSRTGMYPNHDNGFDVSSLAAHIQQQGRPELLWTNCGCDSLLLELRVPNIPHGIHLPDVKKSGTWVTEMFRHIKDGFEAVNQTWQSQRFVVDLWRSELGSVLRRRFFRSTMFYSRVLQHAAHPAAMQCKRAWESKVCNFLGRSGSGLTRQSELQQLARWDYPVFEVTSDNVPSDSGSNIDSCRLELARFAAAFPTRVSERKIAGD